MFCTLACLVNLGENDLRHQSSFLYFVLSLMLAHCSLRMIFKNLNSQSILLAVLLAQKWFFLIYRCKHWGRKTMKGTYGDQACILRFFSEEDRKKATGLMNAMISFPGENVASCQIRFLAGKGTHFIRSFDRHFSVWIFGHINAQWKKSVLLNSDYFQ